MKKLLFLITLVATGLAGGLTQAADSVVIKPGKGITVQSEDGDFSLKLSGRIQARHTYTDADSKRVPATAAEDISTFTVHRLRVSVSGVVFKDWNYEWQGDFGQGAAKLKDGFIEWAKHPKTKIKAGQFKVMFDRSEHVSSGRQTFVDRSIAAGAFGIGRDVGVALHGFFGEKRLFYNVGVFNGEGEGGANPNNGHLYVARLSFNPTGDFGLAESDINKESRHLLLLDAAVAYNAARRYKDWNASSKGAAPFDRNDEAAVVRYVAGAGYRHAGLYATGEHYWQTENPRAAKTIAGLPLPNAKARGFYAQAGYMLKPEVWEAAARYSQVDPDTSLKNDQKTEAVLGVNRFIKKSGHSFKLTADVARLTEEKGVGVKYKDFRSRVQIQLTF